MFVATCSSKQLVSHSASGMSRTTAALLTSPSIRPYQARQASVIRRGLSGSARSAGTHSASPPAAVIWAATSLSGPSRRPARTTGAPTEPSWRAVAAPIPLPPPVTMTTAPRSPASVSTGAVAGPRPPCIATLSALPAPCSYVKHMSICSRLGPGGRFGHGPHPGGGQRQRRDVLPAAQRVAYRAGQHRAGGGDAALARAADTQRVARGRGVFADQEVDPRDLGRRRHPVVHERGRRRLAGIVVAELLQQRAADALRRP